MLSNACEIKMSRAGPYPDCQKDIYIKLCNLQMLHIVNSANIDMVLLFSSGEQLKESL